MELFASMIFISSRIELASLHQGLSSASSAEIGMKVLIGYLFI